LLLCANEIVAVSIVEVRRGKDFQTILLFAADSPVIRARTAKAE
jgi:hypothetical protein